MNIKVMYSLADILNDYNASRQINIIVLKFPSKTSPFVLMKNVFSISFLDLCCDFGYFCILILSIPEFLIKK